VTPHRLALLAVILTQLSIAALQPLRAQSPLPEDFNPGANGAVYAMAIQPDGKILVGGIFTNLGGQTRARIGRLHNTEPAMESLAYDGAAVTWLRGGTGPEVWRTTFDYSGDGPAWTPLGAGSRMPGGWVRAGAFVPEGAILRARGHTVGGFVNASSWFAESLVTNSVAPRLRLLVESVNGPVIHLCLTGAADDHCTVQTTTNLSSPASWNAFTDLTLTNGRAAFDWTNRSESGQFFRAVGPH
jgi:hypothetical protein